MLICSWLWIWWWNMWETTSKWIEVGITNIEIMLRISHLSCLICLLWLCLWVIDFSVLYMVATHIQLISLYWLENWKF